jgi:hypothetical protein
VCTSSRFYGQVDWICKDWPTSQDQSARRSRARNRPAGAEALNHCLQLCDYLHVPCLNPLTSTSVNAVNLAR